MKLILKKGETIEIELEDAEEMYKHFRLTHTQLAPDRPDRPELLVEVKLRGTFGAGGVDTPVVSNCRVRSY